MSKLALIILAFSTSICADQKLNSMTVDNATLFLDGAELHAKTDITLVQGENDIYINGISENIEQNYMQIGFANAPGVKILSVKKRDPMGVISDESDRLLYDNPRKVAFYNEIKALRDQKRKLEAEYQATEVEFAAVSEVIALLQGNHMESLLKNSTDLNKDMGDVLDFVKNNLTAALNEQAALQTKLEDLNAQVGSYETQIEQKSSNPVIFDNIIGLKIYSDSDITVPLSLSYTITNEDARMNSGWTPSYDVRVADINSPLQLTYNAHLFQSSGLDWQNINLTLSTALVSKKSSPYRLNMPNLDLWQIDMPNKDKSRTSAKVATSKGDHNEIVKTDNDAFEADLGKSEVSATYQVNLPYTLKSQTYDNRVTLQTKEIDAKYLFLTTPKVDSSVFLQATIPDWQSLNLLSGMATIYFANSYIGDFSIPANRDEKDLNIMLGKDKDIIVKRNCDLNEIAAVPNGKVSQKIGYTISVKNSKSLPIEIMVNDQLPVIQNQNIVLDEAKYDNATYDKESGLLQWHLSLQPDETKDIHFSFKLTYPKDKVITGL